MIAVSLREARGIERDGYTPIANVVGKHDAVAQLQCVLLAGTDDRQPVDQVVEADLQ